MVSQEELERLFCESTPPILELSEIRKWCRTKQLDDINLQVSHEAMTEAFWYVARCYHCYELPCSLYRLNCKLWLRLIVLDIEKFPLEHLIVQR